MLFVNIKLLVIVTLTYLGKIQKIMLNLVLFCIKKHKIKLKALIHEI